MDIASNYADVYTDFQGLSQLRAEAGNNDKESLRKVAGQFEALFIQMMLKSMRDANLGEGLMDGDSVKTYQSMYDQQIALDLSKRNSLGLADMMVQQLSRSSGSADTGDKVAAQAFPVSFPKALETGVPERVNNEEQTVLQQGSLSADWRPDSPESFVRDLLPHARRAASELGTTAEVLIAQSALETGWGQHMIRSQAGANSFNLFGIKADAGWQGARALTDTVEYRDGLMRRERAPFRAYGSLAECFSDYVDFLKSNPRYREALNQGDDAPAFARALSEAGYATDPDYSNKINRIMGSSQLRGAVSDIKEISQEPLS